MLVFTVTSHQSRCFFKPPAHFNTTAHHLNGRPSVALRSETLGSQHLVHHLRQREICCNLHHLQQESLPFIHHFQREVLIFLLLSLITTASPITMIRRTIYLHYLIKKILWHLYFRLLHLSPLLQMSFLFLPHQSTAISPYFLMNHTPFLPHHPFELVVSGHCLLSLKSPKPVVYLLIFQHTTILITKMTTSCKIQRLAPFALLPRRTQTQCTVINSSTSLTAVSTLMPYFMN